MDRIEKILRDQREELLSTDFSQFVPRQEEQEIDGKTIHRVLATDWLLGRYTS